MEVLKMAKEIFGIELEIPLKNGVSINQFRECMVSAIGSDLVHQPNHGGIVGYHSSEYENNIDKWRVASDSSLREFQGRGVEIVSRRRTSLKETKKVMEATRHLVDLELMTRTTCGGHHVHIGVLHFSAIKRTYNPENGTDRTKLMRTKRVKLMEIKIHEIYAYFQPVLNAIVSRSRRTGNNRAYNRGVSPSYLEAKNNPEGSYARSKNDYLESRTACAPWQGNRGVVNFGSMGRYGTVEYRQHQQTYHVSTVQNWVKLMHRITSRAWVQETKNIDPANYPVSVDGFADFLGLGQNRLRAWMRRRANHFGFTELARENGVNPVVGVRARSNLATLPNEVVESLVNPQDEDAINHMQDEIELAFSNNERLYRATMDMLDTSVEVQAELRGSDFKNLFELPSSRMNLHESGGWFCPVNFNFRIYDEVNWDYLMEKIITNLSEIEE